MESPSYVELMAIALKDWRERHPDDLLSENHAAALNCAEAMASLVTSKEPQ